MLVSTFITNCQREASVTQDDPGFNNIVLTWVIDAVTEFCNETEWKYFQNTSVLTTIAAQRVYTLPLYANDIRAILYPDNTSGLEYRSFTSLKQAKRDLITGTGRPVFWYVEGIENDIIDPTEKIVQIGLYPVPNVVINFNVFQENDASSLVLTDVMPVTNRALLAIKHRVRFYFAMNDKDMAAARIHNSLYDDQVQKLREKEITKTDSVRVLGQTDIRRSRTGRFWRDPNHFHN